jgi:nitrogen regulatory protein PII
MMDMIMIVYNQAIDEEVEELLGKVGIEHYTKWQRVLGKGEDSGPRLDTSVWPGANIVLGLVVKEKRRLQQLVKGLKKLDAEVGNKGLFAFRWPVERII